MSNQNDSNGSIQHLISGLGRSGTTFLAHVLLNAGYDLGGIDSSGIGKGVCPVGGGLEYLPFVKVNMYIEREMKKKRQIEDIALDIQDKAGGPWPAVIKDPRYVGTNRVWHAAGVVPNHVFLCIRNTDEREASTILTHKKMHTRNERLIGQRHAYVAVFNLIEYCQQFDVPHTLVLYPRIGQDRAYAERILNPFMDDPWNIIRSTWDSSLYHQRKTSQNRIRTKEHVRVSSS